MYEGFYAYLLLSLFFVRIYFIVFRLALYHIDVEITQKVIQLLPEDGIISPKHVGAIA
jgi:hypothetical protein